MKHLKELVSIQQYVRVLGSRMRKHPGSHCEEDEAQQAGDGEEEAKPLSFFFTFAADHVCRILMLLSWSHKSVIGLSAPSFPAADP